MQFPEIITIMESRNLEAEKAFRHANAQRETIEADYATTRRAFAHAIHADTQSTIVRDAALNAWTSAAIWSSSELSLNLNEDELFDMYERAQDIQTITEKERIRLDIERSELIERRRTILTATKEALAYWKRTTVERRWMLESIQKGHEYARARAQSI